MQFAKKAATYHTTVSSKPAAPPPETNSKAAPSTAAPNQSSSPTMSSEATPSATTPNQSSSSTLPPKPPQTIPNLKQVLGNKTLKWILIAIVTLILIRLLIAVVFALRNGDSLSLDTIGDIFRNLFQPANNQTEMEQTADTFSHTDGGNLDFLGFVVMVILAVFVLPRLHLKKLFATVPEETANQIILEELRHAFGETASYQNGVGISASQLEEIRRAGIFPEGFSYAGKECFSGVFQGKPFEAAVFICSINIQYGDDSSFKKELFSGLWIKREMQHHTETLVGLCSATVKEIEQDIMKNGIKTPDGLEVNTFNRLFRVVSNDLHAVYYLVTPNQMEQLAAMYQQFHCENKGRICLIFSENQVQYGLNTNFTLQQFWNTKNESASLEQARRRVATKVQEAMQLISLYDTLGF
ncbi:MAG: DUF3137 domain-containing protein [Ruminococcus sp.]